MYNTIKIKDYLDSVNLGTTSARRFGKRSRSGYWRIPF